MKSAVKTFCFVVFAFLLLSCQAPLMSLAELYLEKTYPVNSINHKQLQEIITSAEAQEYLLFDTRSPEEFETSRIATALRLDADISAEEFIKDFGPRIKDKHLVFYCSVGYRSSTSIQRLNERAKAAGALSLANLKGGIFRWYNENHRVNNDGGQTNDIHPVSSTWRILLRERSQPSPAQ